MARAKSSPLPEVPARDGWVMAHWGQERPTYEALSACMTLLQSGAPIDAKTRAYLADVLDHLYVWLLREEDAHRRGRDMSIITNFSAAVVHALHERHGIKVAAAASAMVRHDVGTDESRRKLQQSIERAYRKLKSSGEVEHHQVSEQVIMEALTRINSPKSGNN